MFGDQIAKTKQNIWHLQPHISVVVLESSPAENQQSSSCWSSWTDYPSVSQSNLYLSGCLSNDLLPVLNFFVKAPSHACWDCGNDHCPFSLETWQWTLKDQPPPRQLPLWTRVSVTQSMPGDQSPRLPSLSLFFPLFLLSHYLSPSHSPPFLSPPLQALFTQSFQELPVSPDWLKQTLTLFCYLIQLCSFSSHRPWSTQSIRCPGSHRAPLCDWS